MEIFLPSTQLTELRAQLSTRNGYRIISHQQLLKWQRETSSLGTLFGQEALANTHDTSELNLQTVHK